jgi:hypothetical protein
MTDIVYLCAACASSLAEALRLERLPDSKAEKDTCLLCGRLCYGDRYRPLPRPLASPLGGSAEPCEAIGASPSPALASPAGGGAAADPPRGGDGGGVPLEEVPHG